MSVHQFNSLYYEPDSRPFGISYGEWTVRWWRWAYSVPKEENPLNDNVGKLSNVNQQGSVWFLAGKPADSSNNLPERKCVIPDGISLLFPIINCDANQIEFPEFSEEGLIKNVNSHVEEMTKKECFVNGRSIPIQRVRSDPAIFTIYVSENNVFGLKGSGTVKATADGYWVFLKHLPFGTYTINFKGSCSSEKRKSGADYLIKVRRINS